MLTLPWTDNPLGLNVNSHSHSILFLDWENNPNITGWTANSLIRGMGVGYCPVQYRHCSLPLKDDIAQIKTKVAELKADTIIIDSLGMAVGEDLNLTKPAFQFFAACRQLDPITIIAVAHTAKNLDMKKKTVYGNAYYENEARSIWEIKKVQETNSPELTVNLYHRKPPPFAPAHSPLAYRFTFEEDKTLVAIGDARADARGEREVTDTEIVKAIIADNDGVMRKDIFELSNHVVPLNTIGVVLYRLKEREEITKSVKGYVITK